MKLGGYYPTTVRTERYPLLGPALSEERGHDGHEDRRDHDLCGEGQPEAPSDRVTDQRAGGSADYADQDGHEATDGLHAGHQDACDQADDYSGTEAGPDAFDFHGLIQPLAHRQSGRLASIPLTLACQCDETGYRSEVLLAVATFQQWLGEQCV